MSDNPITSCTLSKNKRSLNNELQYTELGGPITEVGVLKGSVIVTDSLGFCNVSKVIMYSIDH